MNPAGPPSLEHLVAVPTYRDRPSTEAADLSGTDLSGRPVSVEVTAAGRLTLLLFLSSTCDGCRPLWEAAAEPARWGLPAGGAVVAVTREAEDVAALRRLAPPGTVLVASEGAWGAYGAQGAPFFALVDGGRHRVVTEGVAWAVAQVASDVRRALGGPPD
ncbi:MAG: hypothetical protein ACYCU7_00315 [Acidimicrobiales bacterium]